MVNHLRQEFENFWKASWIVLQPFPNQETTETTCDQLVINVIKQPLNFSYNELCGATMLTKKVFKLRKSVL